MADQGEWTGARWLPVVAPLVVAAIIAVTVGARNAVPAAALGAVLFLLVVAGLPVHRWVGVVGERAERLLSTLVGAAMFVALVMPVWLWHRLTRRDPLGARTSASWHTVVPNRTLADARRLAASDGSLRRRRGAFGRLAMGVGAAVILLAANYGVGWTWDALTDEEVDEVASLVPSSDSAPAFEGDVPEDPRANLPSMEAYPWRKQYFDDIQRTLGGYWPFTESRPYSFRSDYLNLDGWVRKSYRTPGDPAGRPTVWVFGGSTTWGEGQRDQYTIASYLARLAEESATPIEVSNYGQRGWTHFQEMILFEQEVAKRGAPDIAVFYDGANEITAQSLVDEAVPTHVFTYSYAESLRGVRVQTTVTGDRSGGWRAAVDAYRSHSAIHKLLRRSSSIVAPLDDVGGDGAGARQDVDGVDDGITDGQIVGRGGNVYDYRMTEQDGIDAGSVYTRGQELTATVAERAGVQPLFYWQPVGFKGVPQQRATENLTDRTIDISDVLLDHSEVFIDGVHTNEEGARIVAESIWTSLGPAVRAQVS